MRLSKLFSEIRDLFTYSYNEAEYLYLDGRLDGRKWMIYCLFWDWCAPRFSGTAGWRQERLVARRGFSSLGDRINRFRSAAGLDPMH